VEQATLRLAREGASDHMLAVDLRRADIESALGSARDGSVELRLDIAARNADGGSAERHTVTVDCTIDDLERMLQSPSETVRVGFDAEALARAIEEPDTEAHGMRDKLAVLAVVVATTGGAAGAAQAMPTHAQAGGTGAVITDVRDSPADSMAASQLLSEQEDELASPGIIAAAQAAQLRGETPVHDMAADTLSASGAASQSGAPVHDMAADTLSASTAASQSGAPVHDMAADTLSASTAAPQSGAPVHDMAADTLSASTGPAAAPVRDFPGEVARSVAAGQPTPTAPPVASQGSGGVDLPGVDAMQFVVVGGIALALIGAAFAVTGVNRRTQRPS